jgi:hypothetical protein
VSINYTHNDHDPGQRAKDNSNSKQCILLTACWNTTCCVGLFSAFYPTTLAGAQFVEGMDNEVETPLPRFSMTVQLRALQPATVLRKGVSTQRQLISVGEHCVADKELSKHFALKVMLEFI